MLLGACKTHFGLRESRVLVHLLNIYCVPSCVLDTSEFLATTISFSQMGKVGA